MIYPEKWCVRGIDKKSGRKIVRWFNKYRPTDNRYGIDSGQGYYFHYPNLDSNLSYSVIYPSFCNILPIENYTIIDFETFVLITELMKRNIIENVLEEIKI